MKVDERASLGWQVFEETNDAVFVTTNTYEIYEVNPFAQRLSGLSRQALIGRPLFELLSSSHRDIQDAIDALSDSGSIELSCKVNKSMASVTVIDDGDGMTESQRAQCFEPFITSRDHGCGLGLSLSQKIVEQHDGTLTLDSAPGKGATVRVAIPIASESDFV